MAGWLREHLQEVRQSARKPNGQAFSARLARQESRSANTACTVKVITPHRLRGTFATLLSEAGVPIRTVEKVMRHKSFTTTMGYLEQNLGVAALAQERISRIAGL